MDKFKAQSFVRSANVQVVRENPSTSGSSSSSSGNSALARKIEMDLGMAPTASASASSSSPLSNANINNILSNALRSNTLNISSLKVGMYNITVNKAGGSTADILSPLTRPLRTSANIGNGLKLDVVQISAIYGRFQKGITVNKNGWKGPSNQDWFTGKRKFSDTYFAVEFKLNVSKGSIKKGVSFTLYSNGKIRFSGGFVSSTDFQQEPELIRKYIVDNYTKGEPSLYKPLEFNNLSGQFKVNGKLKLTQIAKSYVQYAQYEPELSPQLYYTHPNNYKYVMTTTGVIQIQGVDSMNKLLSAYTAGVELIKQFYSKGLVYGLQISTGTIVKTKKSVVTKKSTCPKSRQPVNGGRTCATATNIIRKNPQGFNCCYKKSSKNKNKSQNIRLILDPKFGLKIGTRQCMRYSRDALHNIARKQGVVGLTNRSSKDLICAKLVNTMGIVQYAPFTHNGKEYIMSGENKNFRIGSRVCSTYPLATLRAFANKMGIQLSASDKRADICKKIQNFRVRLPSPKNSPPRPRQRPRQRQQKKKSTTNTTPTSDRLRN